MKKTVLGAAVMMLAACGGGEDKPTTPTTVTSASAPAPAVSSAPATSASATPVAPKPPLADLMKKNMADVDAAWAAHDAKKLSATYADDVTMAMPGPMGWMEAKKADIEQQMTALFAAFPDCKATTTRVMWKGNTAIIESVFTGTNTGDMMGQKATGKKVGYHAVMVNTYNDDGAVKTQHVYYDHATMMGQLGSGPKGAKVRAVEAAPTAAPMMVMGKDSPDEAKNVDAVKAIYGLFEKKDDKAFLAAVPDDYVHMDYTAPADLKGKDGAKKEWTGWFATFPDIKITPTNVWGFDNLVVAEIGFNATMKGALGPIKATNKNGTLHQVDIFEIKDGKAKSVVTYGSMAEAGPAFGIGAPAPATAPATGGTTPATGGKDASAKPATPATPKK